MKKLSLSILLTILQSWIVLSAQVGNNPDTTRCYGIKELQKIADVSTKSIICNDTLLPNCQKKLQNQIKITEEKDFEISKLEKDMDIYKELRDIDQKKINTLTDEISKLERHKRWLKLGWVATSTFLTGVIVYIATR